MSKRSPILGYNHNFSYRGLTFHVQTEDSGVDNPHVFTHLFHGGVILSTRKLDYDAEAAEESVKALMQAQHKAVLKDLKKGAFDQKIDSYLGDDPKLTPSPNGPPSSPEPASPEPATPAEIVDSDDTVPVPELAEANDTVPIQTITEAPEVPHEQGPTLDTQPVAARQVTQNGQPAVPVGDPVVTFREPPASFTDHGIASSEVTAAFAAIQDAEESVQSGSPQQGGPPSGPQHSRPGSYSERPSGRVERVVERVGTQRMTSPLPAARPRAGGAARPAGKQMPVSARVGGRAPSSAVVSRPAVIIGSPAKVIGGATARQTQPRIQAPDEAKNLFGQDLISEKSLDEVILAYLSEDASEE